MPVLHIDHEARIVLDSCVATLEPVVEPTHSLVAPFNSRPEVRVIGERVIPWADKGLDWRLRLREHVRNIVAVSVLQSADQERWNRNLAQRTNPVPPERPIMLVFEIEQRPGRRIK